jgi:peptidoglycan/LPS O-acetylase OafA/YrhL
MVLPASHRDDIDALRAVAVGLVMLFHYGVITGGFVGVDVFFVISGYLIGGIIDRELQGGRFALVSFYERRVRRIFPALFVMMGVVAAVAAVVLFPPAFERFGRSAGAAALFWSNIYFAGTADYWDPAATTKPLLHTWSLAVEEQFYLVFPLILFAIRKWSVRARLATLGGLALVSFGASVWAVSVMPTDAFYLAPYRFWEFVLGAMLAILPLWSSPASAAQQCEGRGPRSSQQEIDEGLARSWFHSLAAFCRRVLGPLPLPPAALSRVRRSAGDDKERSTWPNAIVSLLGLLMIVAAGLFLPKGGAFPGAAALLPCVGAALVIAAGPDNAVSRALAWRPIVFVGLISYSVYLWHWPVIVLAEQWATTALTPLQILGCAVATLALSVASWRFVEQPFRDRRKLTRRPLFVIAGAAMVCVCLFAIQSVRTGGFPHRFDADVVKIAALEAAPRPAAARCFGIAPQEISVSRLCGIGAGGTAATFVLWGDSHAEALLPAIADIANKRHRRGLFAGSPSCAPLVGVDRYDVPDCRAFNDHVLAMIHRHKEITTVILMARWGKAAQGTAYGSEGHGFVAIGDDLARATRPEENAPIFARGLKRTVAALRAAGKRVLLVGPVPEIGFTVPQVLARLAQEHRENENVSPPARQFYAREKDVLGLFRTVAAVKGVSAVFPHQYLCRSGRCAVKTNGIPLYRDEHHLSDYGAKKLEPLLTHAIDPLFGKVG